MKHNHFHSSEPNRLLRRFLAGFVAFVYGATNVVFCHAAEASFWSSRRNAAQKVGKTNASTPSLPSPNDALILAQLPGGVRLDFHGPVESSVMPVSPKEHLVGGKIPVFESDLPRWLADVIAPYGNMRDVFLSKRPGAPLVIQIQDLHDSTEAQRNIAGLVEALQDERGVNLVGLEGAQGAFATEAFRSFPDADITKAVAEHFMEEGYLGGPEFAGITAKRMPLLWGVEDMDAYKANVTAVKNSATNRPEVEAFLREARGILTDVKAQRLSPKLLEFDRHLTGYHSRKEPLGVYTRYLLRSSTLSRAHFSNLVLLQDALHWEDSLDFKRIESERAVLLERLVSGLSKSSLNQLVDRSAMYRLGRISYGDYYRFLRKLCSQSGINLDEFGQLSAYVRYVLLAEKINRNDLLTELSTLERSVQDGLAVTNDERRIVLAARHLALLERLVQHGYTPSDWLYHMTHETEIQQVGAVIKSLAQESGLPESLSPPAPEALKPFEEFCLQALGRNGALVQNLMAKMAAEKNTTAILVAGGFHTEGLTQLLRQKDISYAVVTPKVNGALPDGHRTLELLARDPAPLEKLFAGETINIPTPRMVGQDNPGSFDLIAKLRNGFGIFLLAMFVWTSNAPVNPLDTAAVTVANITGESSATAIPQNNNTVRITLQGEEGNLVFVAHPNTPVFSGNGSLNIQPKQISVQSIPNAMPFMEQLRSWRANLSTRSMGVWNQTIVAFGAILLVISAWASGIKWNIQGAKIIRRVLSLIGLSTFSSSLLAATGATTLAPVAVSFLTIGITLLGLWGLGQLLKAKALQPLILGWAHKLSGLRMQFPGVYFFMGGLLKSIVFPSLGLTILPWLLGGIGLSPALSIGFGVLWATGGYWMAAPLGRAVREGFSWGKLTKEIRSEYRYTRRFRSHSRLSGAFITSGVFVLGLISGFWTAIFIAAGANALWERFRPRGPPGDPFRPAWMGYVTLVWLLLTTPVDQIHVASGDGDDFSSLNGRFGKEMVGIAPGGSLSKRMYFSKRSLFWSRRIEQAKIAKENGFRISRGSGGDEYFVVMKGSGDKVGDAFKNSVKEFNAFGLVNVEGHWRPREVFFTFPNSLDKNQRKALENWGPSIALGKREGGLILSVDRKNTNLTIEKLKDKIKELAGLGETSPVNEVSWEAPDGVAVFTTSMGSVSILDVIRILIIGGTQSKFKDSSLNNAPPDLNTFEKQWIGKENRIKWSKIPEIMVWAFRLPNDALKGSKTGSLTEEGAIKTGSQRKNQAYSLAGTDIVEMGLKAVTPEALVQTRRQWWRGLFRLGRSGVDSLSGTLTQNIFHQRLKDSSPAFMYRLDIASYGNSQNFFERRGFHNRQVNNYPYGNQLIMLVGAAIGLTLNGVQLISRDGPDTYYIASNKEITQDQLNLLVTEIKNNLAKNLLKDQANSEDVVWDPHVALYEVSRKGFEQLNAETTKEDSEPSNWPFIALKQLDQMADAVKVLGEQNPINKIGLDPANFKHTENIIRVAFPNTQPQLKAFEENVEKVAERIVGERSNRNLGVSSQGKAGIAVMAWGVLFGVGILFNYYFGGDVLGMTVGGAALAAMTKVVGKPLSDIVNPNGRPPKDELTPLDFSSHWDLIAERYASLREAYRHSHKLTESEVENKIWSISRYPFRFPKENKSQADDYFNMVVGMCTEWKIVGRGRNRKEVPSPDSDLLRLVLYERANRLISIAKERMSKKELSQEELSEMNWVSNVFSPLAAALPEDESVEYLFGMNVSAVLTDLMFYIADPNEYESKRKGISNYLGGSAGAYSLKNGIETAIRSISPSLNRFDVRLKAVASVLNKSIEKPARYGRVDDFGDLVTGTIVINIPTALNASSWIETVESALERILIELKKEDPDAMVKPLTPDQISEGNSNPDHKEIGITHINIIYRGRQIELQFKDRIHYERLIVGDRVSSVGAVAHYIRKATQIKKRLKEMLGFEELQLRAHRTPIVGNFKEDFAAFWERARRYTIVTALTEAEKKNPEQKVDTIRLPAGAIVADLLAHSRADTDFSFNTYQNASRIEGAETVVLQVNIQPPLALMAPLTTGDQIKISGPYQEMRGRDKREEIRKAARTFRLRYKAVEENDLKAYADRGFTFLFKHGLVIQLKSSVGRPGKNQTPWAMVDKTKDTLNSFLIKHDVDLDMFAVLVGEELGREGSSLTDQRNIIERLMRDFMVRGEIYARRALKNADGISSDGAQDDIEKFMKTLSEPLKSNLFELANIVDNNNKLNEFTGFKLSTIAYLIGVGRLDIEPITQGEKIEIKKLRRLFRYELIATDRPGLASQVFSIAKKHGLNNGNLREIDLSVENGKATIRVGVSEEVSNPNEIEQRLGQINTSTYNSGAVYDQNRRTGWSFSIPKDKDLVDLIIDLGAICKKFNINILAFKVSKDPGEQGLGAMALGLPDNISDADLRKANSSLVNIFPHFDHDNTPPPSGGLWFNHEGYRSWAFLMETPILFGLIEAARIVLGSGFGLVISPEYFFLLFPVLFWVPHLFFNYKVAFTRDVGFLTLAKLSIGFLFWGPQASVVSMVMAVLLLAYVTYKHLIINGGNALAFRNLRPLVIALAFVSAGLLLGFPIDSIAGEVATVNAEAATLLEMSGVNTSLSSLLAGVEVSSRQVLGYFGVLFGLNTTMWDFLNDVYEGKYPEDESLEPIVTKPKRVNQLGPRKLPIKNGPYTPEATKNIAADYLFAEIAKPDIDNAALMSGIKERLGDTLDSETLKQFSFYVAVWIARYRNRDSSGINLERAQAFLGWGDTLRLVGELRDLTGSIGAEKDISGDAWARVMGEKQGDIRKIRNNVLSSRISKGKEDLRTTQNSNLVRFVLNQFDYKTHRQPQWEQVKILSQKLTLAHQRLSTWNWDEPIPTTTVEGNTIVDLDALANWDGGRRLRETASRERGVSVGFMFLGALVPLLILASFLPGSDLGMEALISLGGNWGGVFLEVDAMNALLAGVLGGLALGGVTKKVGLSADQQRAILEDRGKFLGELNTAQNINSAYEQGNELVKSYLKNKSVDEMVFLRNQLETMIGAISFGGDESATRMKTKALSRVQFLAEAALVLAVLHEGVNADTPRSIYFSSLMRGTLLLAVRDHYQGIWEFGRQWAESYNSSLKGITGRDVRERKKRYAIGQKERMAQAMTVLFELHASSWEKGKGGVFFENGKNLRFDLAGKVNGETPLFERNDFSASSIADSSLIKIVYKSAQVASEPKSPISPGIIEKAIGRVGEPVLLGNNVRVINNSDGSEPKHGSHRDSANELIVNIDLALANQWVLRDSSTRPSRAGKETQYPGYLLAVLETVLLEALAKDKGIDPGLVARGGVSVHEVDRFFAEGLSGAEIRNLQQRRYDLVVGMASPVVAVSFARQPVEQLIEDLFPINGTPLSELVLMDGAIGDVNANRQRLAETVNRLIPGNPTNKERDAVPLLNRLVMNNRSAEKAPDYRPGPLAVALDTFIRENAGVDLVVARKALALGILSELKKVLENQSALSEREWKMLALLGALNGSMTESSDLRKWDQFVQFLARPHYNALDLGLLVQTQLANVTASETGVPDVVHQRVESFNEMAEEASVLFDPATVVQNILEGKVDPLFVLSPAMAKGEKAEMTPADWTQLEALRILAERIQNEASDPVVQKWKAGQGRSISLVVVDPNEGTYDLATVLTNISQLVIGNTPFNTLGIKSNNFLVVHGNVVGEVRQVRAKDVISELKLTKVSFHGLDIPGVEWNFEGTEVSIVSLILALSGGLMTQVLPGVVEKLKAEKAIRTAA